MTNQIKIDIVIGGRAYKAELDAVADGIEDIGGEATRTAKDLDGLNKNARTSSVGIDQLGGAMQLLGGVMATLALNQVAQQFITIADNAEMLRSRIKLASEGLGDAGENLQALLGISGVSGGGLNNIVQLFESVSRSAPELNATNDELLLMTEIVAKLTAGVSASNRSAGLTQFSQAMSAGVVRAQEFNSLLENTPLLANQIAEGLGLSVGQLRQMVIAGELASREVFDALISQADEANRRFSELPRTVEIASMALKDQFAQAISVVNTELGVTEKSLGFLDSLSKLIADLVQTGTLAEFSNEIAAIGAGLATLAGASAAVGVLKALALVLGSLAGTVGLFALAAAGAVYFMSTLNEMPRSVQATKDAIVELEEKLVKLDKAAARIELTGLEGGDFVELEIQETNKEISELQEHLKALQGTIDDVNNNPLKPITPTSANAPAPVEPTLVHLAPRRAMTTVFPDAALAQKNFDELMALAAEHRELTEQMEAEAERTAAALQNAWDAFGEGMSEALAKTLLTSENAVDDFLKNIAQKIIQAQIQEQIVGPLVGAISGSAAGGQGGLLGGLVSSIFGGGFATGGQMPANRIALVGENGPELISTGNRGAYVTPNAGAGGTGNVAVNVTNTGSSQVQATEARATQSPDGLVIDLIVGDITNNGPVAQSIQQTLDVRPRV